MPVSWFDLTEAQSADKARELGLPAFRGRQIWHWLHKSLASQYDEMTNLPLSLRERLQKEMPIFSIRPVQVQRSVLDDTVKYLFELEDGSLIESVLMHYHHGYTVCVSSQVGCRMGCRFCASTLGGLERDLSAGEMLQQVYVIEREEKIQVSHIVVMGCGEPFDNYDEVMRFLSILHAPEGQNMSFRNMTVSTCGLLDGLKRFTEEDIPVTLAISLHAPNDDIRKQLMPIANRVAMDDLLEACRAYTRKSGRRVTFEYALVKGVNDSEENARELARRLKGLLCHVNLIPVNPVAERGLAGPERSQVQRFEKVLNEEQIPVTIRRELGRDIDGACGQLRRRHRTEMEAIG